MDVWWCNLIAAAHSGYRGATGAAWSAPLTSRVYGRLKLLSRLLLFLAFDKSWSSKLSIFLASQGDRQVR